MLEAKIRQANDGDFKVINDMIVEWLKWKIERAETFYNVLQDSNHLVLVAEVDRRIVGILHMLFYLDILHGGLNSHVLLFLVHREYRKKQIGQKLLGEAVRQAVKRGVIEMHADTIYEDAAKFYRKYGFKDNGIMFELLLKTANRSRLFC